MQGIITKFKHTPAHHWLIYISIMLVFFGIVMVASSSIPYATSKGLQGYHFVVRQVIFAGVGFFVAWVVSRIATSFYFTQPIPFALLLLAWAMLGVTLTFDPSNGSTRWIDFKFFTVQTSEFVKIIMVIFAADYVMRRSDEVRNDWVGFARILVPIIVVITLIMLQPDLGASIVIVVSVVTIFFLAGAPMNQFIVLLGGAIGAAFVAIIVSPWRVQRVVSFLDPWTNEYGSGFQLTRSLMAIGRGEFSGVGLGHSVLKLSHLPEAHTDFITAIIGEELGFIGLLALILMQAALVYVTCYIGQEALKKRKMKQGYLAYGIGSVFIIQIFINVGMNLGALPTKGLTLPLVSYGGSSLLSIFIMLGLLYRIHSETLAYQPIDEHL